MDSSKRSNRFPQFIASPLRSKRPPPMTHIGDYFAVAGVIVFAVSVFALKWISLSVKDVLGIGGKLGVKSPEVKYGLFVSPWAWGMIAVLVLVIAGIWFVQTRGGITLGAGIYCLLFNVLFFIGAWHKINAIIGDVVDLAKKVPFIGQLLGEAVNQLAKEFLVVRVASGYWLFMGAGALLVIGGALRLSCRPSGLMTERTDI
ncbi:MAG: hypothetical protein CVT63_06485 [Candidatus Anoxymicrobium japonicum]|uniref:Uncharacterized protein n=1 Tax=Candidatus Anoxymicrobium japonicum TaxID=2013648 RepID=A0A2N3G4U3_9ACTN|nr:MAG: hypothetical protein CVT63_06485 [Candidatus Anoxymicrobium japonicum]